MLSTRAREATQKKDCLSRPKFRKPTHPARAVTRRGQEAENCFTLIFRRPERFMDMCHVFYFSGDVEPVSMPSRLFSGLRRKLPQAQLGAVFTLAQRTNNRLSAPGECSQFVAKAFQLECGENRATEI
jgi:hypothetical protein